MMTLMIDQVCDLILGVAAPHLSRTQCQRRRRLHLRLSPICSARTGAVIGDGIRASSVS